MNVSKMGGIKVIGLEFVWFIVGGGIRSMPVHCKYWILGKNRLVKSEQLRF